MDEHLRRVNNIMKFKDALLRSDLETIKLLVESGEVDVNESLPFGGDIKALRLACCFSRMEVIRYLVENGADVNKTDQNRHADCALFSALQFGKWEAAEYLIASGAKVEQMRVQKNNTFLHVACRNERPSLVQPMVDFLLRHGVDVNAVNDDLKTALHISFTTATHCCETAPKLLELMPLESINIRDRSGGTALMYACLNLCYDCVDLLLSTGADANLKTVRGEIAALYFLRSLHRPQKNLDGAEVFRKLLKNTDVSVLRSCPTNNELEFDTLLSVMRNDGYRYLDVIYKEGFQLTDFLFRERKIHPYMYLTISTRWHKIPCVHRDQILELMVESNSVDDPLILAVAFREGVQPLFFLQLVHNGLLFSKTLIDDFKLLHMSAYHHEYHPHDQYIEDDETLASLAIQRVLLLKQMGVASASQLQGKLEQVLSRGAKNTKRVKRVATIAELHSTTVTSLGHLCCAAVRELLYQRHGRVNLNLLLKDLNLPKALCDWLLYKDIISG